MPSTAEVWQRVSADKVLAFSKGRIDFYRKFLVMKEPIFSCYFDFTTDSAGNVSPRYCHYQSMPNNQIMENSHSNSNLI